MKNKNIEFKGWDNPIESILYELQTLGDASVVDEEDKVLIAETLLRMPRRIRTKVLREVVFVMMDDMAGTVIDASFIKSIEKKEFRKIGEKYHANITQPMILLNFYSMKKSKQGKMATIAHEIAHFILGHHKSDSKDPKNERHADDLIEKWGFKRTYRESDLIEREQWIKRLEKKYK